MKTKGELNAIREAQQPQAEDDDRRGWPEHEEPIPNNKPTSWNFEIKETAMTQSDAPNEGRENKTAVDFLIEFSPTPKAGYEDTWILRSMEAYKRQETESLHDQLSKEREKVQILERWKKEEIEIWGPVLDYMQDGGSGKRGPIGASISELVLEILKHHYEGKEREMRKELVGYVIAYRGLASLTSDEDIFIGSLIKKASELDKNN